MQNEKVNFSFLESTYLGLAQAISSIMGTWGFWHIQRFWKIDTKTMVRKLPREMIDHNVIQYRVQFTATNIVTVIVPLWGMLGIWTDKIG